MKTDEKNINEITTLAENSGFKDPMNSRYFCLMSSFLVGGENPESLPSSPVIFIGRSDRTSSFVRVKREERNGESGISFSFPSEKDLEWIWSVIAKSGK